MQMTLPPKENAGGLQNLFQEVERLKHEPVAPAGLDPKLAVLREWQATRLAGTYTDLTASPRTRAVMQFFLQDVYGPRDFSQRNHDMERMYAFLRHVAPEPIVRPLMLTVELHNLTEQLDRELLHVLVDELGLVDVLTVPLYAQAYRRCNNYDARVHQIELIHDIGFLVDASVRLPLSGVMLSVARKALERGGWSELTGFMERGYKVFKPLKDAGKLLDTIRQRELTILDRIYAGEPDPFGFTPKLIMHGLERGE